jgi:peptidoglycan hydrolase-like protein with peptidoglycan-binding domain
MNRLLVVALAALLAVPSLAAAAQNTNSPTPKAATSNATAAKKRGPIFRATKEQIKQAQTLLKQRGLYGGEVTGKLDAGTRDALRKYQEAEKIKVTGTLNRNTLEKMNIALTERQTKGG